MLNLLLSLLTIFSFIATIDLQAQDPLTDSQKTIIFFGDSITAGYGIDKDEAFPALIQDKLKNANLQYRVINAGLSGETTAGGLRRIDWVLKNPIDIFVLELGANDALRGLNLNDSVKNLLGIIEKVKVKFPNVEIFLVEMKAPPNLGPAYTKQFDNVFSEVVNRSKVKLIPFLLQGVAGDEKLNLPDGIHPTAEGHKIIADNIWKVLGPEL